MTTPEREEPWDLVIGRVVAPFQLKGEVRVRPETDFPERFAELSQVCLELPSGARRFLRVLRARLTPKGVLLRFEECSDRDQAAALAGAWIKIPHSMAVPLPPEAYYQHEILGLHAFTEEGRDLGEITEIIRTPAHDVYVTENAMIPAIHQVVRKIDLDRGRIIVSLPLEDEEAEEAAR